MLRHAPLPSNALPSFSMLYANRHRSLWPVNPLASQRRRESPPRNTWKHDENVLTRELRRFAAGLERDRAAVLAVLTLPDSNGQTEGNVEQAEADFWSMGRSWSLDSQIRGERAGLSGFLRVVRL